MNGYRRLLGMALAAPLPVIVIGLLLAGTSFTLYRGLPQELAPTEDRGVFFVPVTTPQGSTVAYTDDQVRLIEAAIQPLAETGEVERVFAIVGTGNQSNRAFVVVRLADWDERERTQSAIAGSLIPAIAGISGARAFPVSPAGLGLRGSSTPLRIVIGGPDFESVKEWGDEILARAGENPNLQNLEIDFEENQPQLTLRVDRDKADDLGIPLETIARTLQTLLASREVTEFVDRGREYPVILQAQREDRQSPTDLANIFVRGAGDELVPLSALVHRRRVRRHRRCVATTGCRRSPSRPRSPTATTSAPRSATWRRSRSRPCRPRRSSASTASRASSSRPRAASASPSPWRC